MYEMVLRAGVRTRILRSPPGTRSGVPRRRRPRAPVPAQLVRQNATVSAQSLSESAERVLAFAQGYRESAFTRYSGNGQGEADAE